MKATHKGNIKPLTPGCVIINTHIQYTHTATCHGILRNDLPLDLLEEAGLCVVEVMFPHGERLKRLKHVDTKQLKAFHFSTDY